MHSDSLQFKKVKKYIMDDFSSHDIDTLLDWKLAETMITQDPLNK